MKSNYSIATFILTAVAMSTEASTLFSSENGDYLKLYGEVGIGGHFNTNYDYGEFYSNDESYIDDSFSTLGIRGRNGKLYYRLELDYERENWKYGSGDMVLAIDKMFIGYNLTPHHYLEIGITDTAFDDYDNWGDYTFDTTVETGEAGDQEKTIKYEGKYPFNVKAAVSFTYKGKSSSGSDLGNITNSYIGYFTDNYSAVLGIEHRNGSEGKSKYGEQYLFGIGARYKVNSTLHFGLNGYLEKEDISQKIIVTDNNNPNDIKTVYNDYQTLRHKGGLLSAKYIFTSKWEMFGSANYETYEHWDKNSSKWDRRIYSWGKSRNWITAGMSFKPTKNSVLALEFSTGEAAQTAYSFARVYF